MPKASTTLGCAPKQESRKRTIERRRVAAETAGNFTDLLRRSTQSHNKLGNDGRHCVCGSGARQRAEFSEEKGRQHQQKCIHGEECTQVTSEPGMTDSQNVFTEGIMRGNAEWAQLNSSQGYKLRSQNFHSRLYIVPLGSSLSRWRAMAPRQITTDSRTTSCCGWRDAQTCAGRENEKTRWVHSESMFFGNYKTNIIRTSRPAAI